MFFLEFFVDEFSVSVGGALLFVCGSREMYLFLENRFCCETSLNNMSWVFFSRKFYRKVEFRTSDNLGV